MRWLTVWGCALLPACALQQGSTEADKALKELKAASVRPAVTGNKANDAFNEVLWSETWSAYASYQPHLKDRARRLEPIPGELKLEKLGATALPAILNVLQEPKLHPVVAARLLVLAGRSGDKSSLSVIERRLNDDQPDLVRRAAARALGHVKAPGTYALASRTELWIRCMRGDEKAKGNFFEAMEAALRPHLLDEFPLGPQIERPQEVDTPAFRREREDLLEDLILLNDVPDRRATALLVEALRHRDYDFPHLANDLLKSRIPPEKRPPEAGIQELNCPSFHDGRRYRAWHTWLEKNGQR